MALASITSFDVSGAITEGPMLLQITCRRCRIRSLWTDDPSCFLGTVCHDPRHCEADLKEAEFPPCLDARDEDDPTRETPTV